MKRLPYIIVLSAVVTALVSGCGKRSSNDVILARIGDRYITLKDLKDRIEKLPTHYQEIVNKNKRKFLEDLIVDELFYEEAIRKGLNREKETKEVIREAKKKILMAKLVKVEVEDKIEVSEEMLRDYYNKNRENFKTPELWRASHILVATEEEARNILSELSKGASFEDLARERSLDATSTRGGDIGYFMRGHLVPEFEAACLKLKPGELSDVVRTQFGFHIIKLTDRKASHTEEFGKVARVVEDTVRKIKRKELFNNLVNRLKETYRVNVPDSVSRLLSDKEEAPATKKAESKKIDESLTRE